MYTTPMAEVDPGGGLRGLQPPLWEVFKLVWLSMSIPFSCPKNIISYDVSSSQIDRYKKTVAFPRQARHLLCVVPSIIVNEALRLDDEVESMPFWEKDIPFLKSLRN